MAKLSRTLQIKQVDLSRISSFIDAVLVSLDDAITPTANWVLELLDSKGDLQQVTGETISADKIHTLQKKVGTSFVVHLKENIWSKFASHDIVPALAIFDPRKVPSADSAQLPTYGEKSI